MRRKSWHLKVAVFGRIAGDIRFLLFLKNQIKWSWSTGQYVAYVLHKAPNEYACWIFGWINSFVFCPYYQRKDKSVTAACEQSIPRRPLCLYCRLNIYTTTREEPLILPLVKVWQASGLGDFTCIHCVYSYANMYCTYSRPCWCSSTCKHAY